MRDEHEAGRQPHEYPIAATDPSAPQRRWHSLVRPYARTGGRTRPEHNLELEAMVSTSERGLRHDGVRSAEQRSICDFCAEPRAVSDIITELGLPLGVAKVIIADMMRVGLVDVHDPGLPFGEAASRELKARLIDSLHNL